MALLRFGAWLLHLRFFRLVPTPDGLREVCVLLSVRVKPSTTLEAKVNLVRMKQEIPLSEEERAAVDDGLAALEKLCKHLPMFRHRPGPLQEISETWESVCSQWF